MQVVDEADRKDAPVGEDGFEHGLSLLCNPFVFTWRYVAFLFQHHRFVERQNLVNIACILLFLLFFLLLLIEDALWGKASTERH